MRTVACLLRKTLIDVKISYCKRNNETLNFSKFPKNTRLILQLCGQKAIESYKNHLAPCHFSEYSKYIVCCLSRISFEENVHPSLMW